jgi:hypothetical protein
VEVDTAAEPLVGRGSSAALTSAIDVCFIRMRVVLVGHSKSCFDEVPGMLNHVTLDGGNF